MSTPEPIAGGAGTLGSYQQQYLFAYILNKPPSFLPLYNSMIDNPNAPAPLLPLITAAPLAFSDRVNLLNDLFNAELFAPDTDPFHDHCARRAGMDMWSPRSPRDAMVREKCRSWACLGLWPSGAIRSQRTSRTSCRTCHQHRLRHHAVRGSSNHPT